MINETPWDFDPEKIVNDFVIKYTELREIVQGGPLVGKLSVNNIIISTYLFGGPYLYKDKYLYVPIFMKKVFRRGFVLARVYLNLPKIDFLSKIEDLIYLDRIENNRIFYYADINKTMLRYCEF